MSKIIRATYAFLSRQTVNEICDSIAQCKSLDMGYASAFATRMIRENIRSQLTKVKMAETVQTIDKLLNFVNSSHYQAQIKDDISIGLRGPEALTVFLSQLSLDAFKAVGEEKEAASIINILRNIFKTSQDRIQPSITTHLDLDYAPIAGYSFTHREAYDFRAYFVNTNFMDFVTKDGYIVGVLEKYENDEVSEKIQEQREEMREKWKSPSIAPGNWTKIYNLIHGTRATAGSVFMLRILLDKSVMYAHGITMNRMMKILRDRIKKSNVALIPSGFADACIDIYPLGISSEMKNLEIEDDIIRLQLENDLLSNILKEALKVTQVSGIPSFDPAGKQVVQTITDLRVKRVDLINPSAPEPTFRVEKVVNPYYIQEIGKKQWEKLEGIETIGWDEKYLYVNSAEEIYYSEEPTKDRKAEIEEINQLFQNTFLKGNSIEDLWVLKLDNARIITEGVDLDQIRQALDYCGLKIYLEQEHDFLFKPGYFYLFSKESPETIIKRHFDEKTYTYEKVFGEKIVSDQARKWAKDRMGTKDLTTINFGNLQLERISHYTYLELDTSRKISKPQHLNHLINHAYDQVTRFPWVDRSKTVSNDWFNVTLALGVDIARNKYIMEPYKEIIACGARLDLRHLTSFAAYVFEKGQPAGIGLSAMKAHAVDFFSEATLERHHVQLLKAHYRKPATNLASYAFTGAVPSRGVLETRRQEVSMMERMASLDKLRADLRFGKKFKREIGQVNIMKVQSKFDTAAMILGIKAQMIKGDPFAGIKLLANREKETPQYPEDEQIKEENLAPNKRIVALIDKKVDKIYNKILNTKKHEYQEPKKIIVKASARIFDVEDIYRKFSSYSKLF